MDSTYYKTMALDLGERRIGIALSDVMGIIASGLETYERKDIISDCKYIAGLVATGLHQSPIPYADVVTTTTHKTLRGTRGGLILTNNEELAKKIDKAVFPRATGWRITTYCCSKGCYFSRSITTRI